MHDTEGCMETEKELSQFSVPVSATLVPSMVPLPDASQQQATEAAAPGKP